MRRFLFAAVLVALATAAFAEDVVDDIEIPPKIVIYRTRSVDGDALTSSAANIDLYDRVLDFVNFDLNANATTRSSMAALADIANVPAQLIASGVFVAQFVAPELITQENLKAIENIVGHTLTHYVPQDGYMFGSTGVQAKRVFALPYIRYVGRMLPQMKLSDQLKDLDEVVATTDIPDQLERHFANTTVMALLSPRPMQAAEMEAVRARIAGALAKRGINQPVKLVTEGTPSVQITVPTRIVDLVALPMCADPEIQWVQAKKVMRLRADIHIAGAARTLLNSKSAGFMQSGSISQEVVWNKGITGAGQIVGIGDSGVDWDNCLFYDATNPVPFFSPSGSFGLPTSPVQGHRKFVGYIPVDASPSGTVNGYRQDDTEGHGTHVAGSVLGYSPSLTNKGMAYDAKMIFSDYGATDPDSGLMIPGGMDFDAAYRLGARIHTNSWGCASPGTDLTYCNKYESQPAFVDKFMWTYPDFLVLFAAGNDGSGGAGTVGSPATCKNCISVGALNPVGSVIQMARFSSQGPTTDGRFKPDVASPGYSIQSAASDGDTSTKNCGLKGMSGTSMATPTLAGIATLVRQYLVEGWYPSGVKTASNAWASPPASLIKAMLIHSTVPVTKGHTGETLDAPPDFKQGFGAPRLTNVLYFPESAFGLKLYYENVARCAEKAYFFEVSGKRDFVVTLVWTDPPATAYAQTTLVNDLDLEVKEANPGFVPMFYANRRTSADRVNNVEKIVITPRAPFTRADGSTYGRYAVYVRGTAINTKDPSGNLQQAYSLVVTGDALREATPFKPARPTCVGSPPSVNPAAFPAYPSTTSFEGTYKLVTATLSSAISAADWTAATYEAFAQTLAAGLGIPSDLAAATPAPVNVIELTKGGTKVVFDVRLSMLGSVFASKTSGGITLSAEQALDAALSKFLTSGAALGKGYTLAAPATFTSATPFSTSIAAVASTSGGSSSLPSIGSSAGIGSGSTSAAPEAGAGPLTTAALALAAAAFAAALARRHA